MNSRKPILVVRVPDFPQELVEEVHKECQILKDDYYCIVISEVRDDIAFELLNGSFWQYFFQWWKTRKIIKDDKKNKVNKASAFN